MRKCPKCGYERQLQEGHLCSSMECPKCGVIYEKYEVFLKKVADFPFGGYRSEKKEKSLQEAKGINEKERIPQKAEKHYSEIYVLKGIINETRIKKANPITKVFSGFVIIFLFIYWLIALGFCLTIIGAIIGIPMFIGTSIFQAFLLSILVDGIKYKIECPVCQCKIVNLFKADSATELSLKCPSCKKDIIIRGDEVLHFK